jgi:hypothetical protein
MSMRFEKKKMKEKKKLALLVYVLLGILSRPDPYENLKEGNKSSRGIQRRIM